MSRSQLGATAASSVLSPHPLKWRAGPERPPALIGGPLTRGVASPLNVTLQGRSESVRYV